MSFISNIPPLLFILVLVIITFFVILAMILRIKHIKIRVRRKTKKEKTSKEDKLKKMISDEVNKTIHPDITQEIISLPMTTNKCDVAVKDESLDDVKNNPHKYIEINMIEKSEIVDCFYVPSDTKEFMYGSSGFKNKFELKEESLLLLPLKNDKIMLCAIFNYLDVTPTNFRQTNKGITANALTLLYKPELYQQLFYADEMKYNFWIVIMLIISTVVFSVGLFLTFSYNGGIV